MAVRDQEFKITMLGSGGVGKSALTLRVIHDSFDETYDPTIEDSYQKKTKVDGEPATLDILDTAGQEEYQALQDQWIREGHGFIIVYAVNKDSTLDEADSVITKIRRIKEEESIPLVLVGNKCDIIDKAVSTEQGQAMADRCGCAFLEVSAKEGINVEECFAECVRRIRVARKPPPAPVHKRRCCIL